MTNTIDTAALFPATTKALARYTKRGGNIDDGRRILAAAIATGREATLAADLWYYGFTTPASSQRVALEILAETVSHH